MQLFDEYEEVLLISPTPFTWLMLSLLQIMQDSSKARFQDGKNLPSNVGANTEYRETWYIGQVC